MLHKQNSFYGVIVLLVVALIISSSFALLYYNEYNQELVVNQKYVSELTSANNAYNQTVEKYNSIAQRLNYEEQAYNGSISSFNELADTFNLTVAEFNGLNSNFQSLSNQYNLTISLLASSIAVLNTSEQAYVTSSKILAQLWSSYLNSISVYENLVRNFTETFDSFHSQVAAFAANDNSTTSKLLTPTEPINPKFFTADFLIDFGNGTKEWYNETSIQAGWNFYLASLVITNGNLNATYYPTFGEHYVSGILGVQSAQNQYWFAWSFTNDTWRPSSSGADLMPVYNGSVYAWSLCAENLTTYLPTCSSP